MACSLLLAGCGLLGIGGDDDTSGQSDPDTSATSSAPALLAYSDTDLFLSGGNVAWNHFARDVGPDPNQPDFETFAGIFQQVREHEGNTMRLWLHTNGAHTPA